MSHLRRHPKNIKRQHLPDPNKIPDVAGVSGVQSVNAQPTPPNGPVALDPNAPSTFSGGGQPLATFLPTVTTGTITPPPPSPTDSESSSPAVSSASKSQLPIGTVVAACIGAFVGAIILISVFFWWIRRPQKSRDRSAGAKDRLEQRKDRGRSWNKLGGDEDRWEGNAGSSSKVEMRESQTESDEKNFPMFKKSPSMRTTRTAKALEEHGIDIPPFEFSQYHPNLAEELSLEQPDKPFATRQNSGSSWDRDTVGDDSFLSLRSVRVDSGTMSPTMAYKMTPPATANGVSIHKWESAEVVHMEDDISQLQGSSNPFADVHEEASSGGNPFFGARDLDRSFSRRSRSNSRGSRHSRNPSRTSRSSGPTSRARPDSEMNPFSDEPMPAGIPLYRPHHMQNDSVASGASGSAFATEQAMRNLIAALNLSPEEVEERLRVASMQGSIASRYSAISGLSSNPRDDDDVATITGVSPQSAVPLTPTSAVSTHAR